MKLKVLIEKDIEEGRRNGVTGTPSIFLNDKWIDNRNISRLPQLLQHEVVKVASQRNGETCVE